MAEPRSPGPDESRREEPPWCVCGHSWGQHPYPGQTAGPVGATYLTDGSCGAPACECLAYTATDKTPPDTPRDPKAIAESVLRYAETGSRMAILARALQKAERLLREKDERIRKAEHFLCDANLLDNREMAAAVQKAWRALSPILAATEPRPLDPQIVAAIEHCAEPGYHKTHRYCPLCPWTEELEEQQRAWLKHVRADTEKGETS